MIKLLILDVDGILTDGTKLYDACGNVAFKKFNDKDWTSIKKLKTLGVDILCLTGDPFNKKILENRNISVIVNRMNGVHKDKSEYLEEIISSYHELSLSEVAYIGDDLFDIKIMQKVGFAFTVEDAPLIVKQNAKVLNCKSGENVIVNFIELKCK
jgi:YrbI family 3-deoxy-D-manno-octulosonate 8-phosphate phosphatase